MDRSINCHRLFRGANNCIVTVWWIIAETLWVFLHQWNYPAPLCSASQDGGFTWGPELPGAPVDWVAVYPPAIGRRMVTSTAARLTVMRRIFNLRPRMGQYLDRTRPANGGIRTADT